MDDAPGQAEGAPGEQQAMFRYAFLVGMLTVSLGLVAYLVHRVSSALARLRGWFRRAEPAALEPLNGRMPTLPESVERMEALRPRDAAALVRALEGVSADFRRAGVADHEFEGRLMADVVDPVLRMVEALNPDDPTPTEVGKALAAATAEVERLRRERRNGRVAAARDEAKDILGRLGAR